MYSIQPPNYYPTEPSYLYNYSKNTQPNYFTPNFALFLTNYVIHDIDILASLIAFISVRITTLYMIYLNLPCSTYTCTILLLPNFNSAFNMNKEEYAIFLKNEFRSRNILFLLFHLFQCLFFFCYTAIGFCPVLESQSVPISRECALHPRTFLASLYSKDENVICHKILLRLQYFSFSMLIWSFGAILLHFSYAAMNRVHSKALFPYFIAGSLINIPLFVCFFFPYTSIFAIILQVFLNLVSWCVVLYISCKKLTPAVQNWLKNQFDIVNLDKFGRIQSFVKVWTRMKSIFLYTLGASVIKDVIFSPLHLVFESVSVNACWFNAILHFPTFNLSRNTIEALYAFSQAWFACSRVVEVFIFYFFAIITGAIAFFVLYWIYLQYKNTFLVNKKIYRYRIFSHPNRRF